MHHKLPVDEASFADGAVAEEYDFGQAQSLHPGGAARRPDLDAEISLRRVQAGVVPVGHREAENLAVALGVLLHDAARRRAHHVGPTQVQRLRVHFSTKKCSGKMRLLLMIVLDTATVFFKLRSEGGAYACKGEWGREGN